jgi:hypothetical protein
MTNELRLGCWIDDSPNIVVQKKYFDELQRIGIGSVAVMINKSTTPLRAKTWSLNWNTSQLAKLGLLAKARDIEVVLTTWPLPTKASLDAMKADMPGFMQAAQAVAFEVDTESNWTVKRLNKKDFPTLDDAAKAFAAMMRASIPAKGRLELTTFAEHGENGVKATLAPLVDRLLPQAYSVSKQPGGQLVDWSKSRYSPGKMQDFTLGRTATVPGAGSQLEVGCGLAAYGQRWKGHTEAEAMELAFRRAVAHGCAEIRFWSSKWILGAKKNGYAASFIQSV